MSVNEKRLVLKDIVIESRASDNFVNATQLCKAGGKFFKDWYKLESTKNLINELHKDITFNGSIDPLTLVDKKVGGNHSGTWIHPDLAVPLAQWISPAFAIQVSRWIRELFTTGTVTIDKDAEFKELESKFAKQCDEMKEMSELVERMRIREEDHSWHLKLLTKEESIYITSTQDYAEKGIFKIGRTKNLKARMTTHNSSRPAGDKLRVLAEFKVGDSKLTERILHTKLRGLALKNETEWFNCPFNMLVDLINIVLEEDEQLNDFVNKIIDLVSHLKVERWNPGKWTAGLDMAVFSLPEPQEMKLISQGDEKQEEVARFDMTAASPEQKQAFVRECLEVYRKTIEQPRQLAEVQVLQISWKCFQGFIQQQLGVPKKQFKASEWKKHVQQEAAGDKQLAIQWRNSVGSNQ